MLCVLLLDPCLHGKDAWWSREVGECAFAGFAGRNVGSAAGFHCELNGLSGAGVGCLVEMFELGSMVFGD